MTRNYWIIVFFLIATNGLRAQDYEDIRFENYSIEHGLPNTQVSCIFQDSEGFIWIATRGEGVSRYDGIRYKHFKFNSKDSTSLEPINISYICEDSKGRLWFAGTSGLACYNKDKEAFFNFKPVDIQIYKRGNNVKKIFEDSRGTIWIGSTTGLAKLVMDSLTGNIDYARHYYYKVNGKEGPVGIITTIQEDKNGILWLGTRKGLFLFDIEKEQYIKLHSPLLHKSNIEVLKIHHDYIWVGATGGIYRSNNGVMDYDNIQFEHYLNPTLLNKQYQLSASVVVNHIEFDYNDVLWGATNSGLLIIKNPYAKFDEENLLVYKRNWNDKYSLSHNNVLWLTFDKDNIAWIGTRNGISKYDKYRYKFKTYKHAEGGENTVQSSVTNIFSENVKGDYVVVGQRITLDLIDAKTGKIVAIPESITNWGLIYYILCDANNSFWMAISADKRPALVRMKLPEDYINNPRPDLIKTDILTYRHLPALDINATGSFLHRDTNGVMWFGTTAGVFQVTGYDKTRLDSVQVKMLGGELADSVSMFTTPCFSITDDVEDNIWIAYQSGIVKYNTLHQNIEYSSYGKVRFPSLILLHNDRSNKHIKWLGTNSSGLIRFNVNNNEIRKYTVADGMSSDRIFGVREDQNRILWISTNKGLCSFNKNNETILTYDLNDGIQGYEFIRRAIFVDSKGIIYMGGSNGFNTINPDHAGKVNYYKPHVKFTGLKINNRYVGINQAYEGKIILNKSITRTDKIKVYPSMRKITLEFAALSYSSSHKNQYKYLLEGYETEWNNTTADMPSATYSNLEGGDYILKVKASNCDKIWNKTPVELKITVVPPLHKTLGFRVGVGIVFILIVMLIYKIRMHRLKQQKIYLELQVYRRTAELQAANVELQEQKEEILSQNEEIQQQTEELTAQRDALEEQNLEISEQKEKLAKSFGRLELLSNFGKKITSSLDIDSINRIMYEFVYSEIDINAFGIGLFIPDREEIIFPSFIEGKDEPKLLRKSINDQNSLVNWSFNNQKPLFTNDIENEYKQYVKILNRPNTSELAKSRIHIPLTVSEKKIGIFVINSFNKNAYSIDDYESLQTLASYISIALDNANAYEVIKNINYAFSESINYAKSIQSAFLPTGEQLDHYVNSFLIYKPKDIVSGDFYWFHPVVEDKEQPLKAFIAVTDCTGHGVPGALISSIGNNLLKESIIIRGNQDPSIVLTEVNTHFQEALKQEKSRNNDGMDMVLVLIEAVGSGSLPVSEVVSSSFSDKYLVSINNSLPNSSEGENQNSKFNNHYKITFSGAKNALVIYRVQTGELEYIKGTRKSIGGLRSRNSKREFEKVELQLQSGDIIYLFTDGIIDQHSPTRERYTRERLMILLNQIAKFELEKQKEIIEREISMHMQNEKQTDDITLLGIKL